MGSKEGILKVAAKRLGMSYDDYLERISNGFKHCRKCKKWKQKTFFHKDSTRGDGFSPICKKCLMKTTPDNPGRAIRCKMKQKGYSWCSGCKKWLPNEKVKQGKCRYHRNKYAREHYHKSEKFRQSRRNRAAQYRRDVAPIPKEGLVILEEKFKGRCVYCGKPATTYDHIVPVSKGGQTTPGNIVPACNFCNSSKKTKDVIQWLDKKGIQPNDKLYEIMILGVAGLYG